jgi:hypothetical protein
MAAQQLDDPLCRPLRGFPGMTEVMRFSHERDLPEHRRCGIAKPEARFTTGMDTVRASR